MKTLFAIPQKIVSAVLSGLLFLASAYVFIGVMLAILSWYKSKRPTDAYAMLGFVAYAFLWPVFVFDPQHQQKDVDGYYGRA